MRRQITLATRRELTTAISQRYMAADQNGKKLILDEFVKVTKYHRKHVCRETKSQRALNFVFYDFRHTFATRMAQAGIDLATLAAILGHNSIRIVQRYVHPTAEHKQSAMRRFEESLAAIDQRDTGSPGRAIQ
jgi:integrase